MTHGKGEAGGAGGGNRTHTALRPPDFESGASASSATPAALGSLSRRWGGLKGGSIKLLGRAERFYRRDAEDAEKTPYGMYQVWVWALAWNLAGSTMARKTRPRPMTCSPERATVSKMRKRPLYPARRAWARTVAPTVAAFRWSTSMLVPTVRAPGGSSSRTACAEAISIIPIMAGVERTAGKRGS